MPQKMKRAALLSVLTSKLLANQIKILNKIETQQPKTKDMTELLTNLKLTGKTLIILDSKNDSVRKSAENIKNVTTTLADVLNAYEVLKAKNIIFEKAAVLKLEEKLKK